MASRHTAEKMRQSAELPSSKRGRGRPPGTCKRKQPLSPSKGSPAKRTSRTPVSSTSLDNTEVSLRRSGRERSVKSARELLGMIPSEDIKKEPSVSFNSPQKSLLSKEKSSPIKQKDKALVQRNEIIQKESFIHTSPVVKDFAQSCKSLKDTNSKSPEQSTSSTDESISLRSQKEDGKFKSRKEPSSTRESDQLSSPECQSENRESVIYEVINSNTEVEQITGADFEETTSVEEEPLTNAVTNKPLKTTIEETTIVENVSTLNKEQSEKVLIELQNAEYYSTDCADDGTMQVIHITHGDGENDEETFEGYVDPVTGMISGTDIQEQQILEQQEEPLTGTQETHSILMATEPNQAGEQQYFMFSSEDQQFLHQQQQEQHHQIVEGQEAQIAGGDNVQHLMDVEGEAARVLQSLRGAEVQLVEADGTVSEKSNVMDTLCAIALAEKSTG